MDIFDKKNRVMIERVIWYSVLSAHNICDHSSLSSALLLCKSTKPVVERRRTQLNGFFIFQTPIRTTKICFGIWGVDLTTPFYVEDRATPFELTRERGVRASRIARGCSRGSLPLRHSFDQRWKKWAFHYLSRILHRDVLRWNNSLVILFLRLKPPRPQSNHHAVMLSCAILAYTNQNRLTNLPFGLKSFISPAGTETARSLALELVKYLVPFSDINLC